MYDRILIPTDDAQGMETVFEHAAGIARPHGATIHVVHVVDKRAFLTLDDEMRNDVERQLGEQGERTVEGAADWFDRAGLDVETARLSGDPAEEVIRYADEADVDLIVTGTRRRNYNQTMLGSVSRVITDRADSPVLVVDISDGE